MFLRVSTMKNAVMLKDICILQAVSKPAAVHKFSSSDLSDTDVDDANSYFISAVCWKTYHQTMLAANSLGTIKVIVLAT